MLALLGATLLVLGAAGYALRGFFEEEFHLYYLHRGESPEARKSAAKALAGVGTPRLVPRLLTRYLEVLPGDAEAFNKEAKVQLPKLVAPPESESWHIEIAIWNIVYRGGSGTSRVLEALLRDPSAERRTFAARTLGLASVDLARTVRALEAALKDEDADVQEAAFVALGRVRNRLEGSNQHSETSQP